VRRHGYSEYSHGVTLITHSGSRKAGFNTQAHVAQQANRLTKSKRFIEALAAAPKLTPDQAKALWLYTCESPLYGTLNRLLRARNRAELKAGFFPLLRLLLEAFAVLATPELRIVNRGVALDLVAANPDLYVKGSALIWWGFASTMTDISALQVRRASRALCCPPPCRVPQSTPERPKRCGSPVYTCTAHA
jgi:hypothetical protein